MTYLNQFDWRQIKLTEKLLLLFENKKINLFELYSNLDTIACALEEVSVSWIDDFHSKVNFLETVDDAFKDGSISKWQGDVEKEVHETVRELQQMVSDLLSEYLKIPDPNISKTAIEGDSTWLICPNCFDAWESTSSDAMVFCPVCEHVCHNPRFRGINS